MMGTPAERDGPAGAKDHATGDRPALVARILQELVSGDCRTDATVVLPSAISPLAAGETGQLEMFAQLSAALVQSRWLEALAGCQRILRNTKQLVSDSLRANLGELRKSIEQQLLVRSSLDLVDDRRCIHLLSRRSVLIGRPGGELPADIAIECRWLSRGERNLSLFCDGPNWFLEDLGSTNGNFVNGSRLTPGAPMTVPVGRIQIQVGRFGEAATPIILEMRRPKNDPGAVVVRLRHAGSALTNKSAWPTVQRDLTRTWIVFRSQIAIAASDDCAIRIADEAPGIAAAIRYQNGFWAVPSSGSTVNIDGTQFEAPVPIPAATHLSVRTARFRVEASPQADIFSSKDVGENR